MKASRPSQIEAMGARRLKFSLDDSNPLALSWPKYKKPFEKPSFDMHCALEFGLVLKGAVRRLYGGRTDGMRCGEGDAWFCGIWELHGFSVAEAPAELFVAVIWPPALSASLRSALPAVPLDAPFSAPPARRPSIQESLKPRLAAMAGSLRDCDMRRPFGRFRAWLRFQDMLSLIVESWRDRSGPAHLKSMEAPSRESVTPAIELVFSKRQPTSLEEGAAACGMGRSKFAKLFSEMMGTGYAKFGLRHRLGLAAKALLDRNMTLKDAAFEGGFADASHLHKVFVANFGCGPDEYRRKLLRMR